MTYKSEHLLAQLREVREASGTSQRALSERTGLTQSHISQIEGRKLEPGLSSFIELARALDLEPILVPKKLIPAVLGIIRAQAGPDAMIRDGRTIDKKLIRILKRVRQKLGGSADFDRIEGSLELLQHARLGVAEADAYHRLLDNLEALEKSDQPDGRTLHDIAIKLQHLRNMSAHNVSPSPRAAYALDDEDDSDA
ncbi:helix-turn-helix transcriptional regulator [Hyphomicrobium sp.]|uniref:helix-turn-helix domain-containing protein n=1 Tax=Hyphomicrobium sp. TaxID=82 RepID=UPI002E34EDA8|nr:helix-turn-helix transcriptional regulator [Hyphomicrobium sp.]HEX2839936.1 helix-turn-helix transcriptional regulator [Hyphomicrobium sp.]